MKKLKIFLAAAAVLAIGAVVVSSPKGHEEDFYLTNVEALSGDEAPQFTVNCFCKERVLRQNVCSVLGTSAYCGSVLCANFDSNCR